MCVLVRIPFNCGLFGRAACCTVCCLCQAGLGVFVLGTPQQASVCVCVCCRTGFCLRLFLGLSATHGSSMSELLGLLRCVLAVRLLSVVGVLLLQCVGTIQGVPTHLALPVGRGVRRCIILSVADSRPLT